VITIALLPLAHGVAEFYSTQMFLFIASTWRECSRVADIVLVRIPAIKQNVERIGCIPDVSERKAFVNITRVLARWAHSKSDVEGEII
jgi:hypothetical protein